jgi:hypothetical protein
MRVEIKMGGTSPLLMHNAVLADPSNGFAKAIAEITDKGSNMTEADRLEVARLEFFGGGYFGTGGPIMPSANILRCVANAGKTRRLGRDVERAMIPTGMEFPIAYKGPREVQQLWADERFRFTTAVRVGRGLVQRTRIRFVEWAVVSAWELIEEVLDFRDFQSVVEAAGLVEGLGDGRRIGFGRFQASIAKAETGNGRVSAKAA